MPGYTNALDVKPVSERLIAQCYDRPWKPGMEFRATLATMEIICYKDIS